MFSLKKWWIFHDFPVFILDVSRCQNQQPRRHGSDSALARLHCAPCWSHGSFPLRGSLGVKVRNYSDQYSRQILYTYLYIAFGTQAWIFNITMCRKEHHLYIGVSLFISTFLYQMAYNIRCNTPLQYRS